MNEYSLLKEAERMVQPGPMEGITVLDFTHVLAGPFATMLLGEHTTQVLMERGFSPEEIKDLEGERVVFGP